MLNSGYGALGAKNFLYYMVENAEAITMSGQLVNKWTCQHINTFLRNLFESENDHWIYSDTDSGVFTIKEFVDTLGDMELDKKVDTIDEFCEQVISPVIRERCQELCDYLNCYEQMMVWEREVIANRAVWVGKKKYVISVLDSEGTRFRNEPKYKIMGMESVKSSTPEWSRKYLKECYKVALTGNQEMLHDRLDSITQEFYKMSVNDIAVPRGVNNIQKYLLSNNTYGKGTPKHVKAAIVHNRLIDDLGIKTIQKIQSGMKIKFLELKKPNPLGEETVAFETYFPKEFKHLEKYVDRDTIFEKSFLQPLRIFLTVIGWSEERKIDLFSF